QHLVLGLRVVDPALAGGDVHLAHLPALEGIVDAGLEAALLFLVAHREPVLDEVDAVLDEHALEHGALDEEALVLLFGAEPHHPFHAGPVVPAAVEQNDLAALGKVGDVALEVPLGLLALVRRRQGGQAARPGAEVVADALDDAALAGGVAALEHDGHPLLLLPDPFLQLDELDLEAFELLLVNGLRQLRAGAHSPQSSSASGARCSSKRSAGHLPESSAS